MKSRMVIHLSLMLMCCWVILEASETEYGKKLTLSTATPIAEILADPVKFDGRKVLVEGTITGVCEMMGCWIMIQDPADGAQIQFKVEDGVITFPVEEDGKSVRAEGIVDVKTLSVEEQIKQGKHHAEETGTEFDASTVTGPKTSIRLLGEGAVIN